MSLHLTRPTAKCLATFLEQQHALSYTYPEVGATATAMPASYNIDHTRREVGQGEHAFQAAAAALKRWDHFRLGWVMPFPGDSPIRERETIGVLARAAGVWWANACRIVYVIDEPESLRFGYAYGTLPGHAERGEERFLVEADSDGRIWYDIHAFSYPRHPLAWLGYPWARRTQRRFARDSGAALICGMQREHAPQ